MTIGAPNPTTRVYILNSRGALAQPGMIGRIHLAGVQVSYGYLGMPRQTEERFLLDSVVGNGEKMYDSGDLGYWSEEGEVVCVGRNDRQVKLRGYRLDLNDLEIRIARDICEVKAVAIALRCGAGDELVAMVQPASLDLAGLRRRLADTLPRYAIPKHIIAVDKIPTTSAGKVDYKAVASAEAPPKDSVGAPALVTNTERAVAAAFLAVLKRPLADVPLSRHHTLAEMGGHSIEQIKVARYLTRELHVTVTLKTVISNPTIQGLAQAIDQIIMQAKPSLPILPSPAHPTDVTPIEQEWLDKSRVGAGTSCFNVAFLGRLKSSQVDSCRLEDAFNIVLKRHKILRSTYHPVRGPGQPRHRRSLTTHIPRAQRLDRLNAWAELNRPFKLDQEPPVRIIITRDKVLVTMSHVVADYTTLSILLREVSSVYQEHCLPPPRSAYPDPTLWGEPSSTGHCDFWRQYLKPAPSQPSLLLRSGQQQRESYQGRSSVFQLDNATSSKILEHASSASISLQQLALAAVALALADDPSAPLDVTLGVPFMNRESAEHAETVGLFLQPLPVRITHDWPTSASASGSTTATATSQPPTAASSLLSAVRDSAQAALAHRLPWHQLLAAVSAEPDYPDHPLLEVMVTFLDRDMVRQLRLDVEGVEPCYIWSAGAKFKLMCEFMAVSERSVLLRVEYDHACVSLREVEGFQTRVAGFLRWLVAGANGGGVLDPGVADGLSYGCVLEEEQVLGRALAELA